MQATDCQMRQCRACLSIENELLHIFDDGYQNILKLFSGYQVTQKDCLPKYVCVDCVGLLKKFVKFRETCRQSRERLLKLQRSVEITVDKTNESPVKLEGGVPHGQVLKIEFDNITKPADNDAVTVKREEAEANLQQNGVLANETVDDGSLKIDWRDLLFVKDYNVWNIDSNEPRESNESLVTLSDTASEPLKAAPNRRKPPVKRQRKKKVPAVKKKKIGREPRVDPTKIEKTRLSIEEQKAALVKMSQTEDYLNAPFKCKDCFKYFLFEDNYVDHIRTRHDESIGPHVCPLCSARFKRQETLRSHAYKHSVIYRCIACAVTYKTSGIANQHYKSVHEGVPSTRICHLCGRISKSSGAQGRHMKLMHSGPVVKIQCSLCPSTFLEKADFKTHMRYHSGAKPFKCDICGTAFPYRDIMQRHRLTHSDEKNFYCIPCDIAFRTQRFLDTHLKISPKHGGRKQKFNCVLCRTPFTIKSEMLKHKEREHGIKAKPKKKPEGRNHQCETCGKAFSTKEILKNHIRTHTGERPFSCATCGSAFTQKAAMRTHVKLVHLNIKRSESAKKKMRKIEDILRPTVIQESP